MNLFASLSINIVLHAEKVLTYLGIGITNSMLLGWLVSAFLLIVFIVAAWRIRVTAGGKAISLIEIATDGVTNLASEIMDRERAVQFAPFFITLFCFILINNWAGLLPGVGSITYHGVPLFRAWTSDLTGTLALSISSILIIQIYTAKRLGAVGHLAHYFTRKPWNPINLFIGLLEVLGEFTRIASLSLRLFGNIFAGEVLLLVLGTITDFGSPAATLPFIFMELFVGFIQAFVFMTLVIVYLTLATTSHDESAEHSEKSISDHATSSHQPATSVPVSSSSV